ncbi:MAG: hypothetical protein KJ630_03715 [Proteobacteria bacterium]|nr:hypothetical protein [Pseudomonadota bacterium]
MAIAVYEQNMTSSRSQLPEDSGVGTLTFVLAGKNILCHFHRKKKQKLLSNTISKSINRRRACAQAITAACRSVQSWVTIYDEIK